jgi:hypothetical protein
MWNPFKRQPTAFEAELEAVRAIPERHELATVYDDIARANVTVQPVAPIIPPIPEVNNQSVFARPPQIDKFPTIIGAGLTGQYISSCFRLCNSGWRYQYVDLLDELLENDPDTRAVVRARILGIACGRYHVEPAELGVNASDDERELAKTLSGEFALEWVNIPYLRQRLQQLAWADWYGISGHEIKWAHPEANRWEIEGLSFIHSRRVNLTNPTSWDFYIYDQGLVGPGSEYLGPTVGVYGLPVAKYPGKFLIHTPSLSGQYPTRDGEGRYVAFYMLLKRMVTRCSAQDFERVIRPWVVGYFNRKLQEGHDVPLADKLDIQMLEAALSALGAGSMNSAALPNSVKIELLKSASAMTAVDFIAYLNRAIAKALLGQAFTTEPGANGNLATAQVADKNTGKILEYSVSALCDTLREGLITPWLQLNHPGISKRFAPRIVGNVSDLPSMTELMAMATQATEMDIPVDQDDLAARTTLKILAKDDTEGRRTRCVTAKAGPNPAEDGQPINDTDTTRESTDNAKPNNTAAVAPASKKKPKDNTQ